MRDQYRVVRKATTKRGATCWVAASPWYSDKAIAVKEYEAAKRCAPEARYRLVALIVVMTDTRA